MRSRSRALPGCCIALLLSGCGGLEEVCEIAVPASAAIVRDGERLTDATGSHVYVCPNATAEVDAAGQTLMVGSGAVVDFSGSGSTVYADGGSSVELGGAGTDIFAEEDVEVDFKAIDQDETRCRDVVLAGAPDC